MMSSALGRDAHKRKAASAKSAQSGSDGATPPEVATLFPPGDARVASLLQSAENNVERRDARALASQISAWDGLLASGSNPPKRRRLAAEQGIPLGEQGRKRLDAANLQDVQAFFVAQIAAEQLAGHLPFWRLFSQQTDAVTEVLRWIACRPKDDKATKLYVELGRWQEVLRGENREAR